ncbi:MAG: M48 family metalloprotease [Planctomycetes bacterium]|nr:M48 family metalloprotease [Planctomycetota bacterium]
MGGQVKSVSRYRGVIAVGLLGAAAILGGCYTNPTTGRSGLEIYSHDQEIAIGQQYGPQFVSQSGGEVNDAALKAYVTELGMKLKEQVETPEQKSLPWTFALLNSPEINAFALPGGKVHITIGLAKLLKNEAEMAGVLGHEIGHVTARHGNERAGDSVLIGIGAAVAGVAVGDESAGRIINQSGELVLLKFSRKQESEADYLGMRYMTKAGYNPIGQKSVMEVLRDASKGGRQAEIFATHPYPETRIEDIERLLRGEFAYTQNNPQYVLNEERYRNQFLSRAASINPPAPKKQAPAGQNLQQRGKTPQQGTPQQGGQQLPPRRTPTQPAQQTPRQGAALVPANEGGRAFDLSRPVLWCTTCQQAEAKQHAAP